MILSSEFWVSKKASNSSGTTRNSLWSMNSKNSNVPFKVLFLCLLRKSAGLCLFRVFFWEVSLSNQATQHSPIQNIVLRQTTTTKHKTLTRRNTIGVDRGVTFSLKKRFSHLLHFEFVVHPMMFVEFPFR